MAGATTLKFVHYAFRDVFLIEVALRRDKLLCSYKGY